MSETNLIDCYKSISKISYGLYRELGSRFISIAYPVTEEEEIHKILKEIKKEYYDARHHCYAYRLGLTGEQWRANDDGEPSSSAGRPILGQLLSNELSDTLIVVIRYFGGTKLGVPGLIRAYKTAAADAIQNNQIISKTAKVILNFSFEYALLNDLMKLTKETKVCIKNQEFDNLCKLEVSVGLASADAFAKRVKEIGGKIL